jgi:Holliday junction resolvase RusA-like endonuclease
MKIPFRLPSLNEYINICRSNKYAAAKHKKEVEDAIGYFLKGRYDGSVKVRFIWYEPNRRRDVDNVAFAKKYILDAMQKRGVLKNDNQVVGFTDCFVYGQGEGVEIEILEV